MTTYAIMKLYIKNEACNASTIWYSGAKQKWAHKN